MHETELYGPVKAYLESRGYAVKGEVEDCDLVAVRDDEPPVIVELKTSFTLALVFQGITRQSVAEDVYLGVPPFPDRTTRRKDALALCRRLGLGLLTVRLEPRPAIKILLDPAEFRPRRRKVRLGRLLREFERRVGDPNEGGSTRRKLVTSYRQDALRCASYLALNGPTRAAVVAGATGVGRGPGHDVRGPLRLVRTPAGNASRDLCPVAEGPGGTPGVRERAPGSPARRSDGRARGNVSPSRFRFGSDGVASPPVMANPSSAGENTARTMPTSRQAGCGRGRPPAARSLPSSLALGHHDPNLPRSATRTMRNGHPNGRTGTIAGARLEPPRRFVRSDLARRFLRGTARTSRRRWPVPWSGALLALVMAGVSGTGAAQDSGREVRAELAGKLDLFNLCPVDRHMDLLIDELPPHAAAAGLTSSVIRDAIERRLRDARVYDPNAAPFLRAIVVFGKPDEGHVPFYSIELSYLRELFAERVGLFAPAETWSTTGAGQGDAGSFLAHLDDLVNEFIAAYHRVRLSEACRELRRKSAAPSPGRDSGG